MYKLFSNIEVDGLIEINNFKHSINIFITPWSIAHFISGYIFLLLGFNYFWGLVIHSIYEYINLTNDSVKKKWKKLYDGFRTDSFFNSIGDTIFFLLGMYLAKHYNNNFLFFIIFIVGVLFFLHNIKTILPITGLNILRGSLKIINSNQNLMIPN